MSAGRTLPIEPLLPEILGALSQPGTNAVIEAPPGAGKTTTVPVALLQSGLVDHDNQIIVLQPRRLAARLAAQWVARGFHETVGQRVGYQVRFDAAIGAATRIVFLTEGLLLRRLVGDPLLRKVGVVVFDEFHERHLDSDLCLALVRALQGGPRPDLRVVVMSATLDGASIGDYLKAPVLRSLGRAFPVEVHYQPPPTQEHVRLGREVALAFRTLAEACEGTAPGHILAFLPGARAIREAQEACRGAATALGYGIFILHGELSKEDQDAALAPTLQPKLILATNVAETSITIEGVNSVIDTGLANVASFDAMSGYARLRQEKISQASAIQRMGRAGRTAPGRCIRLYSKNDFDRRPAYDTPEVARADLLGPHLLVAALGLAEPDALPWFEAPPRQAWQQAGELLRDLEALDPAGRLTAIGEAMLRYPIHPRLARLLVEAESMHIGRLGAWVAALLAEPALRRGFDGRASHRDHDADVLADLDDLQAARDPEAARRLGLDAYACQNVVRAYNQLKELVTDLDDRGSREAREAAIRRCMLVAYPDRVGKVRLDEKEGVAKSIALAGGGQALLDPQSVVRSSLFVVALVAETVQKGMRRDLVVRSAAAIDPDWLIDRWPDRIEERDICTFDRQRGKVVNRSEMRYAGLLLDSTERPANPVQAGEVLAQAVLDEGIAAICDVDEWAQLKARTAFLAAWLPGFPVLTDKHLREVLVHVASQCSTLAQVRQFQLMQEVQRSLGEAANHLDRLAPTHVRLPSGRRAKLHYEDDRPPGLSSRLQDFFGFKQGPTVLEGKVPVRLHLLAPNQRDVQVTTDLAGFWHKHYPEIRKALMRRYPRHSWPEDPLQAEAPPAKR